MKFTRRQLAIFLSLVPLFASLPAWAQTDWPTRPVRFLVPWPAGGLNDVIARTFNDRVSQALGQTVITDFKAGAAGRIGVTEIAKAKPDGYTIGMGNLGPLTIFPSLYRQMPYSVKDDLIPITMFAASPLVLVVAGNSPIRTAQELIDAAKAKPGALNFASVGLGSPAHLTFELLKKRTGIDLVHVPYKGTNESLPALFAGDIQATFDTLPSLLPHIQAGRLRALAVTTLQRVPQLPDVPSLKELSLGDAEVVTWYAVIAPAGTPQPIVDRLNAAMRKVGKMEAVVTRANQLGVVLKDWTPGQMDSFAKGEVETWGKVIRDNKITFTE